MAMTIGAGTDMSSRRRIYVGPYVRCENKPVDVEKHVLACSKPLCPRPGLESQFCATCGSVLIQKAVKERRKPVDSHDVCEEIRERLYPFGAHMGDNALPDYDLYVANVSWHGESSRNLDDIVGESRILDSDPPSERVHFEMAFKDEIARIRRAYGDKNVEVHWGALGAWS